MQPGGPMPENRHMTRRVIIVGAVAFGVLLAAATLQAQSLADVARAEAERREQVKGAGTV